MVSDEGQDHRLAVSSWAAPVLVGLGAIVAAVLVVGSASGADAGWRAYLAPAGTCHGANASGAPTAMQARTIGCLLDFARAKGRRRHLERSSALRRAAALKGRIVASCGQFSHTPCGVGLASAVRAAGYRYALFGEDLFTGPWGRVSPRDVVAAWLRSPAHRAVLLGPRFRDLGVAAARAQDLLGPGDAVVWTAAFGSRP